MKSNWRLASVLLTVSLLAACRKSSDSGATPAPSTQNPAAQENSAAAPAPSKERHHALFSHGASPLIVSMSPETILVHEGHAPMQRFSLSYEINDADKATHAYISVYANGIGEVQKFDVDLQPKNQIEFLLDPSQFDFGPTVRVRAHCESGYTEWYTMGSKPPVFFTHSSVREISSVYPNTVPARGSGDSGVPLDIRGVITRDCTPEVQIDGSTQSLENVVVTDREIRGVLPYSALQGRPVLMRHLEVNLVVEGTGFRNGDIYYLNFSE
jgi:hypothetical protein